MCVCVCVCVCVYVYIYINYIFKGSRRVITKQIVGYHTCDKKYGNERMAVLAPKDERKSNSLSSTQFRKSEIVKMTNPARTNSINMIVLNF